MAALSSYASAFCAQRWVLTALALGFIATTRAALASYGSGVPAGQATLASYGYDASGLFPGLLPAYVPVMARMAS